MTAARAASSGRWGWLGSPLLPRRGSLWIGATLALAQPLAGQEAAARLSGLLVTEGTGEPVAGAIVALVDAEDAVLGETLSNESGAFSLPLPPPGAYRVRVTRIGYESWASDALDLPAPPESRALRLEVPVQPIPLPDLLVTEQNDCPTTPEERERAFELYQSVLPALRSVSSTADLGVVRMRLVRPAVAWSRGALRYAPDTATVHVERVLHTASPEHLETYGYADVIDDSTTTFYAPDGDALSSPGFVATHCLSTVDSDEETLVGLGFEPKPGRLVVDIRGVLWIDGARGAPEALEFEFTSLRRFIRRHLEPAYRAIMEANYVRPRYQALEIDESAFGGFVHFDTVGRDRWIIRRWKIVRPILGHNLLIAVREGTTVWPRADTLQTYGEVLAIIPP